MKRLAKSPKDRYSTIFGAYDIRGVVGEELDGPMVRAIASAYGNYLCPEEPGHFDNFTAKTRIKVNFKHSGLQERFTEELQTAAYRIIQEALTNVVRHAKVNEVLVASWTDQDVLWVRIEDKGTGFDQDELPIGVSSGLYGMHERARSLGGELIIESKPGTGTVITARLPILGDKGAKEE